MEIKKLNYIDQKVEGALRAGMIAVNRRRSKKPFMVSVKENGEIIGGAACESDNKWMYIKLIWTKDPKMGLGAKIMSSIEEEARKRRNIGIHVNTYEDQALDFYKKMGFKVFGKLESGNTRYYLKKKI